jgi:hypothetical protein
MFQPKCLILLDCSKVPVLEGYTPQKVLKMDVIGYGAETSGPKKTLLTSKIEHFWNLGTFKQYQALSIVLTRKPLIIIKYQ